MNLLYCGYNYRNVDNFRPLLDELAARGHAIGYCAFPHAQPAKNLELGEAPFQRLAFAPFNSELTQPSLDELRDMVHRAVREFSPAAVLLDDIFNYPSNAISTLVKEVTPEVPVLAFQHGFFQFWSHYRRFFACDFFLAYGPRSQREFLPHQQERVISLGLPKLSRLAGVPVSDDGTVLYLAQDTPRWQVVAPALKAYAKLSGRQVRVRLHPQFAERYEALAGEGLQLQYATDDVTPHLASCHAVITTGSTAGMEAMVMGKPVVSLPSYSSYIFTGSPAMANDYTGEELWRVIQQWPERQHEVRSFREDSISPLSFDLAKAADCLEELITQRRAPPASPERALLEEQQRTLVAQQTLVELRARWFAEEWKARSAAQTRAESLEAQCAELRARNEQQQAELASLREQLQAASARSEVLAGEVDFVRARYRELLEAKPPMRYRVVDLVNTGFKRTTPGLHHGLKRLLDLRRGQS